MEVSRVPSSMLEDRLDASFYSARVLDLTLRLKSQGHPRLGQMLRGMGRHPMCYGFEQFGTPNESTVPFLKGESLSGLSVSKSDSYVDSRYYEQFKTAQAISGDVVMSVRGTIGRAAVCRTPRALCSPNTIILKPLQDVDPEYLTTFLATAQGQLLVQRQVSGTVQDTITEDSIRNIQAFQVTKPVQEYIGEKVRLAERLRVNALNQLARAKSEFTQIFQDYGRDMFIGSAGRFNYREQMDGPFLMRLSSNDIQNRLDARAYNPNYFRAVRYIRSKPQYMPLKEAISFLKTGISNLEYNDHGMPIILTKDISVSGVSTQLRKIANPTSPSELTKCNDCLLTTYGGPSIGKVGLVRGKTVGCFYDYTILRLTAGMRFLPGFLYLYLQSALFQHQLAAHIKGTTGITFTLTSDIQNFLVPCVTEGAQAIINKLCIHAVDAQQFSSDLSDAAKFLVEALIEGQIKEEELKEAQKQMELGDTSRDRKLLSRITVKGIDIANEPPLFTDLDALYEMLERTSEVAVA